VAGVERRLGHAQQAEDGYRSAIAVNENMLGDGPATPSDQQNLASAYFALGNQLLDDGNSREALPFLQRSHDLVQEIAEGDPRNALFQKSLAIKNLGLCRGIRAMNEAERALAYCREGLVSLQKLSAADPGSGDKRLAAADALRQLDETELAAQNASATPSRKRR
jgi:hypothetical protein